MGGSQSHATRKITIPNEDNSVNVSDSVADRIKKCQEAEKPENKDKKEKKESCKDEFQDKVSNIENIDPRAFGSGDAVITNYLGPSLTSVRLLQEKEKELRETEKYWSKRIQNLENHHFKLSRIMEQEYDKSMKEISCQVPRKPPNTPQPCVDKKELLISCYKRHPNQALLCAEEVSEFAKCVHNKRISSAIETNECVSAKAK